MKDDPAVLLEAVMDPAFIDGSPWIVVDFKTDAEDLAVEKVSPSRSASISGKRPEAPQPLLLRV
jgi:hypothetical protein